MNRRRKRKRRLSKTGPKDGCGVSGRHDIDCERGSHGGVHEMNGGGYGGRGGLVKWRRL